MRLLLAFVVVVTGCASSLELGQPAADGPSGPTPHPVAATLTIDGDEVTDSDEITGWCLFTHLWSAGRWTVVLTTHIENGVTIGPETFCELGGNIGPYTYSVPISELPAGWYTVCNMSQQCTEPFERT